MTSTEYERIKAKIVKSKETTARAKGAKDRILEQLEKDFGIHSIEDGKEQLVIIRNKIEKDKGKKDAVMEKLEKVTDWDSI